MAARPSQRSTIWTWTSRRVQCKFSGRALTNWPAFESRSTGPTKRPFFLSYGLLGPSGCGKTSILRCILGRLKPSTGRISVFGFRPGTRQSRIPGPGVGFQPQVKKKLFSKGRMFGFWASKHPQTILQWRVSRDWSSCVACRRWACFRYRLDKTFECSKVCSYRTQLRAGARDCAC